MSTRYLVSGLLASLAALGLTTPAIAGTSRATFTGDAASAPASIEVQSWSWGASNAGSGRREASSGMASGKRQHKPLRVGGPYDFDGSITIVSPRDPATGQASGKRACVVGTHFPTIVVESVTEKVSMSDLSVTRCTDDGMVLSYATATDLPVAEAGKVTKPRSNIQNN